MEAPELLLTLCAAASAVACIVAGVRERQGLVYVFKPLTMVFILAIALQPSSATTPLYRTLVVIALLFSLAGDVFLMLPGDRFLAGLASFLVAHLVYIAAFGSDVADASFLALLPWLVLALPMYGALLPHLGSLRLPVALYVTAIVGMAWQATARAQELPQLGAQLACVGAGLFVLSDAVLAWNRFRGPLAGAQPLVLASYFSGQCLIALSLGAA